MCWSAPFLMCAYAHYSTYLYCPTSWDTVVCCSSIWALLYFTHFVYLLFVFSAVMYALPNLTTYTLANNFQSNSLFSSIDGLELARFVLTPVLLTLLVHTSWSGPVLTAWFGHLVFSAYQFKVTYLLFFFFTTYTLALLSSVHYSSLSVSDYLITSFNFFAWLWLMFFSNNLFTFVFFLEILSASITLLLVTSTFSSTYFYNNTSYESHTKFQTSTPTALLQTLMVFFWVTLVSSLSLFVMLVLFYLKFLTFDWNLVDALFTFIVHSSSVKAVFNLSFCWLLVLICVFIKCGIVPFYLWKPSFFKGMSLLSLFFYVYVYYFSIFLFFVYVLFAYLNELFLFNIHLLTGLLIVATVGVTPLLFESFYVKAFLALSSILNSILVFYALCSSHASDFLFLL